MYRGDNQHYRHASPLLRAGISALGSNLGAMGGHVAGAAWQDSACCVHVCRVLAVLVRPPLRAPYPQAGCLPCRQTNEAHPNCGLLHYWGLSVTIRYRPPSLLLLLHC